MDYALFYKIQLGWMDPNKQEIYQFSAETKDAAKIEANKHLQSIKQQLPQSIITLEKLFEVKEIPFEAALAKIIPK